VTNVENLELNEVVIDTLVELFDTTLPGVLAALNPTFRDGITLNDPVQIVPYMPTEAGIEAGMPLVAVSDLPSNFDDDTVSSMTGYHELAILIVLSNTDHPALAKELRRYVRALMLTVQEDRAKDGTGLLPSKAGVWYTGFKGIQPGPLLGDRDPDSPSKQPSTFLSWSGLVLRCTRGEI
jgi:hypothetical protein